MALRTFGSNATTSLQSFVVGFNDLIPADVATMNNAFRDDPPAFGSGIPYGPALASGLVNATKTGTTRKQVNQAYVQTGVLFIPNRGRLQLCTGDFVVWDTTTGWPFVISGDAAANGPYTHS